MTTSTALFTVALALALAGLWPFGPYQATLWLARGWWRFPRAPQSPEPPTPLPVETFAICLCVYNEARVIRDKLEDLLRLRAAADGRLEILVYCDAARDGTEAILREYADHIRLFVSPERRGKTFGMNLLVCATDASIVLFTDANVLIDPGAMQAFRRWFQDPSIGCVCSTLSYVNAADSPTAEVGARYWRFNEWTKRLETETGSVIGADGSLFAIRRALHRPVPKGLFDDLYVSLSVLLQGYRVVSAPDVRAFETHTTRPEDEFRRKVRIACECWHVHRTLWPELRRLDAWNLYKYLAHRVARWLSGWSLAGAASATIAGLALHLGPAPVALGLVAGTVGSALAYRLGIRPIERAWNVVLAFAGAGLGVWRAVRGERAVVWEVPESARRAVLRR